MVHNTFHDDIFKPYLYLCWETQTADSSLNWGHINPIINNTQPNAMFGQTFFGPEQKVQQKIYVPFILCLDHF